MTETPMPVGVDPAGKWIEPADERPVGMDAAAFIVKEDACVVVLVTHAQHGAARFGMLCDEFRRRHAKAPRKP